jgi:hypothetical protein
MAAFVKHSMYDSGHSTRAAREAFMDRFERKVDPDLSLPIEERQRRAEAAKKAYFTRLAYLSARARGRQRQS